MEEIVYGTFVLKDEAVVITKTRLGPGQEA